MNEDRSESADLVRPHLSVIAPFHNEEDVLDLFIQALRPELDALNVEYEVVLVDDGSRDGSWGIASTVDWPQLRAIRLQRNVGHMTAIAAGLDHARGNFVVTMDSDLQHPPALISALLAEQRATQVDVVYGVREDRGDDTAFKRVTAGLYYRLIGRLTRVELVRHAAEFRLMTHRVIEVVCQIPERQKVLRLLLPALGFTHSVVPFMAHPRAAGTPKYSIRSMVGLAWSSVLGFSSAPLRLIALLGAFIAGVSFLWLFFVFGVYFAGITIPGWTSLFVAVLMLGGVQLVGIGMLGEYVARIFDASKGRPAYVIRETRGSAEAHATHSGGDRQ